MIVLLVPRERIREQLFHDVATELQSNLVAQEPYVVSHEEYTSGTWNTDAHAIYALLKKERSQHKEVEECSKGSETLGIPPVLVQLAPAAARMHSQVEGLVTKLLQVDGVLLIFHLEEAGNPPTVRITSTDLTEAYEVEEEEEEEEPSVGMVIKVNGADRASVSAAVTKMLEEVWDIRGGIWELPRLDVSEGHMRDRMQFGKTRVLPETEESEKVLAQLTPSARFLGVDANMQTAFGIFQVDSLEEPASNALLPPLSPKSPPKVKAAAALDDNEALDDSTKENVANDAEIVEEEKAPGSRILLFHALHCLNMYYGTKKSMKMSPKMKNEVERVPPKALEDSAALEPRDIHATQVHLPRGDIMGGWGTSVKDELQVPTHLKGSKKSRCLIQ